jgi:uncharacterized membrane protein YjgN (DUF898 family)
MTVETAEAQSFRNTGKFFDVLGLALKNDALTILTLTLYRFCARTSMRRRVWSRVWIMGDALEYTGSAFDLFRGFLISLPCFFLPAVFVYYIAPLMMDPPVAGLLAIGFYLVAIPLVAAARYWMRRYQLSRTRWRGIRMALAGSAWTFAFASSGWTVLQWLSLGWYTPVARMNQARMLWQNARFGDQPFEFIDDGHPRQKGLWWPFALAWFSFVITPVIFTMAIGLIMAPYVIAHPGAQSAPSPDLMIYAVAAYAGAAALSFVVWQLLWAPYNAAAMNRIASLISLDGARFKLKAKTFSLFLITMAGWLLILLSVGLLSPVAGFLRVRYVIARLQMIGAPRFAEIGQSVLEGPGAGESLANAFDLDMGVGII